MVIPAAIQSAIKKYVAEWNAGGPQDVAFDTAHLRLLLPHRIYRYMGEHRAGKADLGSVKPAGWRCFARTTQGNLVMLDAFEAEQHTGFRLHVGSMPERWLRVIRSARRNKRLAGGPFLMRTMVAPAVHLSCLWFSTSRGKHHFLAMEGDVAGVAARWMTRAEWRTTIADSTTRSAILWKQARTARRPRRHQGSAPPFLQESQLR